jgi:hypothetical protein
MEIAGLQFQVGFVGLEEHTGLELEVHGRCG